MNNYVPLDVCSSYSTGDSICQVPRLVRKAREMGFPALALMRVRAGRRKWDLA